MMKQKTVRIIVLISLFMSTAAVVLLMICIEPLPFGNDLSFHLSRINALSEALEAGILFPGVYGNYPMGYGAGLFYPDVFLYIPVLLIKAGADLFTAYKIFIVLTVFFSGVTMYISVSSVTASHRAGLISALIYTVASFHITDLYYRASVGELCAFVFLPLVVAGIYHILWGKKEKWLFLAAGFSGVILSHILSAVIMILLCALICAASVWRLVSEPERIKALLKAAGLVFLLTAFFTLPFLEQLILQPISGDRGYLGKVSDWAVSVKTLIFALPSLIGSDDSPPPGIGLSFVVILLVGFWTCFRQKNAPVSYFKQLIAMAAVLLFMCTVYFPWELFDTCLGNLQFPWRLYLFITVMLAFVSGDILTKLKKGKAVLSAILLISMAVSSVMNIAFVYTHFDLIETNPYPTFGGGYEYLPEKLSYGDYLKACEAYNITVERTGYNTFETTALGQGKQIIPIVFYPGYRASVNGKAISVTASDHGLCQVDTLEKGILTLSYTGTFIKKTGNTLTLITLMAVSLYILRYLYQYYKNYKKGGI